MKLTLTQFISLDGVSQGPGSPDEDTADGFDRGGWFVPFLDDEFMHQASEWLGLADGLLLGRRTYDAFALAWPQITDPDDLFTARMNGLPKYVASNSLDPADASWGPVTVLAGDTVAAVAELKQQPGRELQIHGSTTLSRSLLAAGLVDELRLVVAPVIVGSGRRLFADTDAAWAFRPLRSRTAPGGLSIQEFELAGAAAAGTYSGGVAS